MNHDVKPPLIAAAPLTKWALMLHVVLDELPAARRPELGSLVEGECPVRGHAFMPNSLCGEIRPDPSSLGMCVTKSLGEA